MIAIGQQVLDFEVEAYVQDEIRTVRRSDYNGKWLVLIFYPADFTFICPTELEEAAQLYPKFQELDAEVVSVSTDTVWCHKAWHDQSDSIGKIGFPMVADPTGNLCREFGTYIEAQGVSLRGTFLINPDGKLVAMELHDNSVGRNMNEMLRKLQAAAFMREHAGQVCPASWKPGSPTLTPGLDLVGKL